MTAEVVVRTGLTYGADGKLMDVYRPAGASEPIPAVLLWHGRGPDQRDVLAPVARAAAELGAIVLVPDWRSDAADGGRAHLCDSADFARQHVGDFGGDPERIALAGWSLGGKAAVGGAVDPAAFGDWRPRAVVGTAGAYATVAPSTGIVPIDDLRRSGSRVPPTPVWLVHGTADPVVAVERSRDLRSALDQENWPVSLDEVATDHAGVIMTEFVPKENRCLPSTTEHAVAAGTRTALVLAAAAGIRLTREATGWRG
ncbi:alpha/beta hydrolase [Streptomyces sp. IBSBF 3136]|uniref:alpha/beta hydrolase n=1 Tax=Streptomyces sp. IBSBF 3136 TaxID=2903524 RepID=UPI002FDBB7B9